MARDTDVLVAIQGTLESLTDGATPIFDGVRRHTPAERQDDPASDAKLAFVTQDGFEERPFSNCPSPSAAKRYERTVRFTLAIQVSEQDPDRRRELLDLLGSMVANAITGANLGGITIPAKTWVRRGQYRTADPPFQELTLSGEASYFVSGYDGRDASDNISAP